MFNQYNPYNPYGMQMQPPQPFMQQMQMQSQPTPSGGLNRVTGADGARAFTIPPGSVAALFDDTRDVFYIKTTDSGGFPTLKAYRFAPLEDEPQAVPAPAISREEIQAMIREEIEKYGKQFVPAGLPGPAAAEHDRAVSAVRANDAGTRSKGDA